MTRTGAAAGTDRTFKELHEQAESVHAFHCICGIDVSAATLAAAVHQEDQRFEQCVFNNNASGHRALIAWLHKRKARVRVSLEATGIYSPDLAVALDRADGIEVAVLNPKLAHRFAQTLRRSKTDSADAARFHDQSWPISTYPWTGPIPSSNIDLHMPARPVPKQQEPKLKQLTADYIAKEDNFASEISWEKLRPSIVQFSAVNFTDDQIDRIVTFYKSPAGQAMREKELGLSQATKAAVKLLQDEVVPQTLRATKDLEDKVKPLRPATPKSPQRPHSSAPATPSPTNSASPGLATALKNKPRSRAPPAISRWGAAPLLPHHQLGPPRKESTDPLL